MEEIGIETSLVEAIISGEKTVEVRLGKPRFLRIQSGDDIHIREDHYENDVIAYSLHEATKIHIEQVLYFETFDELFSAVNYESITPKAKSKGEALKTCRKFYSKKDEKEYGVVALFFSLV